MIVTENPIATFAGAFAVEVRRHGRASRNLIAVTLALLGGVCVVAIVGAQFYGDDFMALFGPEYREPGGAILAILVLGLPASSIRSLSSAANRLRQAGWRNFAQHLTYCAVLFAGFSIVTSKQANRSRCVSLWHATRPAAVSLQNLNNLRTSRARATAPATPSAV